MSADNGIYIGIFPKADGSGKEYRVIEAAAIENCNDDPQFPQKVTDAYLVIYYGDARVMTKEQAQKEAFRLQEEYEWTEYGICTLEYSRPFPTMTKEEAEKVQEDYWEGDVEAEVNTNNISSHTFNVNFPDSFTPEEKEVATSVYNRLLWHLPELFLAALKSELKLAGVSGEGTGVELKKAP